MRLSFLVALISALGFGVAYWYVNTASICPTPILYRLGEVDERFGVTNSEARQVLADAERVWEEAIGRDLFAYSEETDFTVNFMYDERQKEASTEETWRIALDAKEKKVETLFAEIEQMRAQYEIQRTEYESNRSRYESALASYNNEVENINATGGATQAQYDVLSSQKNTLTIELQSLLALEQALNQASEEINKHGEVANSLVESYNAEVVRYNGVYGERNETFTQGDYERTRINVYTFSTTAELAKVLAHEFGHALGIGHVEGGESLMYYLMADQPDELRLSAEDQQAFITVCGDGTDLASTLRRAIRTALIQL